jgi:hypothetical protein
LLKIEDRLTSQPDGVDRNLAAGRQA